MTQRRLTLSRPKGRQIQVQKDQLDPHGRVEIFVTKGAPKLELGRVLMLRQGLAPIYGEEKIDFSGCQILGQQDLRNIIVNVGKDQVVSSLGSGFVHPVLRMAVGDRGTIPSDSTVPKTPQPIQEALFNEVCREDLDAVVLNVGTPTVHQIKFIKTFSASVIPITAFSNQAAPVINEVGLITADQLNGAPFPRPLVASPAAPLPDERLFAIRTFKSVPFEAAEDISVTIRYTIFIE